MKTSKQSIEIIVQKHISHKKKGFTLVELIIVITILAILATIAFISFQNYFKDARDSVRLSDLQNISKGLSLYNVKTGLYPDTESGITITASGTTIGYQGYFGNTAVQAINYSKVPLDPLDKEKYIYSVNANKTKYQLLGFTENPSQVAMFPQAYAADYSNRGVKTIGDSLGFILQENGNMPTENTIDTATGSKTYKVVFKENTSMVGSGNLLSVIQAQRGDKTLASLDESLIGYWDMESTIQNGSLLMLKDLSKYGNHGTCYDSGSSVNCGESGRGAQFVEGNGRNGKMMKFDGNNDRIRIGISKFSGLSTSDFTISSIFNTTQNVGQRCIISTSWNGYAGFRYGFGANSSSSYLLYGANVGQWEGYVGNIKVNDGLAHNLVARFLLNDKIEVFVDGIYVGEKKMTGAGFDVSLNKSQIFDIGTMSGYYPNYFISGLIDEIRIYNRALSDSEVQALYQATK